MSQCFFTCNHERNIKQVKDTKDWRLKHSAVCGMEHQNIVIFIQSFM